MSDTLHIATADVLLFMAHHDVDGVPVGQLVHQRSHRATKRVVAAPANAGCVAQLPELLGDDVLLRRPVQRRKTGDAHEQLVAVGRHLRQPRLQFLLRLRPQRHDTRDAGLRPGEHEPAWFVVVPREPIQVRLAKSAIDAEQRPKLQRIWVEDLVCRLQQLADLRRRVGQRARRRLSLRAMFAVLLLRWRIEHVGPEVRPDEAMLRREPKRLLDVGEPVLDGRWCQVASDVIAEEDGVRFRERRSRGCRPDNFGELLRHPSIERQRVRGHLLHLRLSEPEVEHVLHAHRFERDAANLRQLWELRAEHLVRVFARRCIADAANVLGADAGNVLVPAAFVADQLEDRGAISGSAGAHVLTRYHTQTPETREFTRKFRASMLSCQRFRRPMLYPIELRVLQSIHIGDIGPESRFWPMSDASGTTLGDSPFPSKFHHQPPEVLTRSCTSVLHGVPAGVSRYGLENVDGGWVVTIDGETVRVCGNVPTAKQADRVFRRKFPMEVARMEERMSAASPPAGPAAELGKLWHLPVVKARPCIYFLFDGSEVVYVGQTVNLLHRLGSHVVEKHFTSVRYLPCRLVEMDRLEAEWIDRLKPKLNRMIPPLPARRRPRPAPAASLREGEVDR